MKLDITLYLIGNRAREWRYLELVAAEALSHGQDDEGGGEDEDVPLIHLLCTHTAQHSEGLMCKVQSSPTSVLRAWFTDTTHAHSPSSFKHCKQTNKQTET